MDVDGLKPWLPVAGETAKAYHAFSHFLTLPVYDRSLALAYTNHLIHCKHVPQDKKVHAPTAWTQWRFAHSWLERCAAHDAEEIERDRQLKLVALAKMNERHITMATQLQSAVAKRLQLLVDHPSLTEMRPVEMAAILREATRIERTARDVPTSIVKHEGDTKGGAQALDLSKLTNQELHLFQELVAKAMPGLEVTVKP